MDMRKIEIPQSAIVHHEATLGRCLLEFLKRLADGTPITWIERKKRNGNGESHEVTDDCQMILKKVRSKNCLTYWNWVHDQFMEHRILTASVMRLCVFSKENEKRLELLSNEERSAALEVVSRLFDYEKFRNGEILLFPRAGNAWRIQWFKKANDAVGISRKRKCKKTIEHEKEFEEWKGWGITEFIRMLDVRYCPYCNAETVGAARLPDRAFLPDIDHILPKEKYPLLALSLFNLVPACSRCNSRFKKANDMLADWDGKGRLPSLHPYVHNIHKHIRFNYRPTSVTNLFLNPNIKNSPLTVSVAIDDKMQRAEKYITDYHLREVYRDIYYEEINEMIRMEAICSPQFEKTMKEKYGLTGDDFNCLFRRVSLHPCDINHFRFAKLVGDLHDVMCVDVSSDEKKHIVKKMKKKYANSHQ